MKSFLSILLISFCYSVFAQLPTLDKKRANIWYFGTAYTGYGAPGLDFSSGQPVVLTNGVNVGSTACTISNADGNLQMYPTQFPFIANALHDSMANSKVIMSGSSQYTSQPQHYLFVPNPSNNGLIYIFTYERGGNYPPYLYHIVDMNMEGGLGAIISINNPLYADPTVKQTAVHHSNCRDVWVVSHQRNSNNFYAYLVTDTGVVTNPVISSAGYVINNTNGYFGGMKLSPNGKKIAYVAKLLGVVQLFDFDNSNGIISNAITLPTDSSLNENNLTFSPDGTKLYICSVSGGGLPAMIHQFDVSSGDSATIVNSRALIGQTPLINPGFSLQGIHLAPNGKIYIGKHANSNLIDSLAVIHNPNALGLSCNFELHAIRLYGRSGTGLNNLIQSYFNEDPAAYPCFVGMENQHLTLLNNDSVAIYPNPFYDKLTIELNKPVKNCRITIHDLQGRAYYIDNRNILITMEIMRKNIPQGVYILKIQGENFLHTAKIITIN
ncbi:MAG: T9SS type A sorting domain-containing protein [Chitinophagales bacterium]